MILARIVEEVRADKDEFLNAALMGRQADMNRVSAPYRLALAASSELLQATWQQVLSDSRYEQGKIFGQLMFEIVGLAAVFVKAANVSKLEFLTQLRAKPIFQKPRLARAFDQRLVGFRQGLATSGICFVAGTPVHTEHGLRPIESNRPGGRVLSRDP